MSINKCNLPKHGSRSNVESSYIDSVSYESISTELLEEKGRLQFFFHSPSSELPIRDILNEHGKGHKTEPHIEIGAENYINCCYQSNNIAPFLKSNEKYLFLFTTCMSQKHKYYRKKCIVGYIIKKGFIKNITQQGLEYFSVCGETYICSFDDALPLRLLNYSESIRIKIVNCNDTAKILDYFKERDNILNECIKEIRRLDEINRVEAKTCKVLKGQSCIFKDKNCLRWNLS